MRQGKSQAIDIAIRRRALLVLSGYAILRAMADRPEFRAISTSRCQQLIYGPAQAQVGGEGSAADPSETAPN